MKKKKCKKRTISRKILDGWIWICEKRGTVFSSQRLEKEMGSLFPGKNAKEQMEIYYLEKIEIGLKAVAAGGFAVLICVCNVVMNNDLREGIYIDREQVKGGKKEVTLDAEIGNAKIKNVLIEIDEKEKTDDEIKKQLEAAAEALPERILGKNTSLEHVIYPLKLVNTGEDTLVSVFWSSSNYGILQEDGSFGDDEVPQEGIEVILTAVLSYKEMRMEKEIAVMVFPVEKSNEEKLREELLGQIEVQKEKTRTEDTLILPQELNHIPIVWRQQNTGDVFVVTGFVIAAVFMVLWGKDKDIHEKYEERNKRLLLEYSEFVSKLQLLISSGMSIRSAFAYLGREYQKRRKAQGGKKYVYEELLIVVRKMENGMSETEAYDYFGRRCELVCYKKLAALILQNIKRGTDGLKEGLAAEVKTAFEERKQTARKMGEEAGTKLLFPMMLMMSIVLIIIVIPAYFSFGGM